MIGLYAACIFQSTLPRGSDERTLTAIKVFVQFQSTLPRGSDPKAIVDSPVVPISIHAPSRERPPSSVYASKVFYFNPRSLAGATVGTTVIAAVAGIFQSTLPRGSDLSPLQPCLVVYYFNPRSLAGATLTAYAIRTIVVISIHAPSRERLPASVPASVPSSISIHAPSRERRSFLLRTFAEGVDFNPRSLAGATISTIPLIYLVIFQSTLPRGSDA